MNNTIFSSKNYRRVILIIIFSTIFCALDYSNSFSATQENITIPMSDGIQLNAILTRPDTKKPLPAVIELTPYVVERHRKKGEFVAEHDFVSVRIDSRGCGGSEGVFVPFESEIKDGYDVIEWIAAQDWCDGKVGMYGLSYAASTQLMALKKSPPHLKTIVNLAPGYPGVDCCIDKNIMQVFWVGWLNNVMREEYRGVPLNKKFKTWEDVSLEVYLKHLPYSSMDKISGKELPTYHKWISHPMQDAFWDSLFPTKEEHERIDFPILSVVGGWSDGGHIGGLTFYKNQMNYGKESAKKNHHLIIGPWEHGLVSRPIKSFGGIEFGDASVIDMSKLIMDWFGYTLKGKEKPSFLKDRVAYYVPGEGAEKWIYENRIEDISNKSIKFYLHSENGKADHLSHPGSLSTEIPEDEKPDSYIYDPLTTKAAKWADKERNREVYFIHNSIVKNLDGDGVIYDTAPFEKATQFSGWPKLNLWMKLNVPDTDFRVILFGVLPDGTSIRLTHDMVRARYRESLREEKLIVPGEINEYVFDRFYVLSRNMPKGSFIRVLITALNTPFWQKNYNSGKNVHHESGKDAKTAIVTIYHNEKYPSSLSLPVVCGKYIMETDNQTTVHD
ncbi:CocE/NonD family hydrolase [Acidobacteriota bacterium]